MQLGGSSPERLARAAEICADEYGYDEINLNCGCPSARVVAKKDADKCFGASLMRDPDLVGECLRRMKEAVDVPVTVKHRLGTRKSERSFDDSGDCYAFIADFVDAVHERSGVDHFIVHARAAVLGGLSPSANRNVPPLRYAEVHRLADDFPKLGFTLNGGVETVEAAETQLASGVLRGVMMGRAIYRSPAILADVDARIYGVDTPPPERWENILRADDRRRDEEEEPSAAAAAASSSFFSPSAPLCSTRRDVLERFSVYGDGVLRAHLSHLAANPRALRLPRSLLKAATGMVYGVRGGNNFRKTAEVRRSRLHSMIQLPTNFYLFLFSPGAPRDHREKYGQRCSFVQPPCWSFLESACPASFTLFCCLFCFFGTKTKRVRWMV